MSDLILDRCRILATLLLVLAACSGETGEPSADAAAAADAPLADAQLLDIPRAEVTLTLTWTENVVSRDPRPDAAPAVLRSVTVSPGQGFDRTLFEFATVAEGEFPGYRIAWNDPTNASCEERAGDVDEGPTLLVRFDPATTRDPDQPTEIETSLRPGLAAVASARQLCEDEDRVVWALATGQPTPIRVIELHTPPRLMVDVLHRDMDLGSGASQPADAAPTNR